MPEKNISEKLLEIASKHGIPLGAAVFSEPQKKISVSVLGRFKSGKSSFLNRIAGRDILPVSVLPATAVTTFLEAGETDSVLVIGEKGEKYAVSPGEIGDYVREDRNPGNSKKIKAVEIRLASLGKYANLRFVDTPGTESVFRHNSETAFSWIPGVQAAFVALSCLQPLAEGDISLIRRIVRNTCSVSVLLTKADLVSGRELDEITDFTRNKIMEILGEKPEIFPFSVKPGYEELIVPVEEWLAEMAANREREIEKIMSYKLARETEKVKNYLKISLAARRSSGDGIKKLRLKIERNGELLPKIFSGLRLIKEREKALLSADLARESQRAQAEIAAEMRREFESEFPFGASNIRAFSEGYLKWLYGKLSEKTGTFSNSVAAPLAEKRLKTFSGLCVREADSFSESVAGEVKRILGVDFRPPAFSFEIRVPPGPDIKIGRAFDTPAQILGAIMPVFFLSSLLRKKMPEQMDWEIEKNLSRTVSQWLDIFSSASESLLDETEKFARESLSWFGKAVSAEAETSAAVKRDIMETEEMERKLKFSAKKIF